MEQIEGFHPRQRGKTMLNYTQFGRTISYLSLVFLFCAPAYAQQEADRTRGTREQGRNNYGVEEPADFAQENLGRVAASARQIRTVLVKDEGLLVELKRWVAKEATDNGQVVEDSNLTDQAVFERLEQDVAFRSVATRLLQRYGYLMPTPNPDSDFAKEKELVLKGRASGLCRLNRKKIQTRFVRKRMTEMWNARRRAIHAATKTVRSNPPWTAGKRCALEERCLHLRRILKGRQSKYHRRTRRGSCKPTDYRKAQNREMARVFHRSLN